MIYLMGLVFQWFARALMPALGLLAVGAVLVAAAKRFWLRQPEDRKTLRLLWGGLFIVVVGLLTVQTRAVTWNFRHPELRMFRTRIADPIPAAVANLRMATPAPAMFSEGALIAFEAPPELFAKILDHSLPGATGLAIVDAMKRERPGATSNTLVLAGTDGRSYVRADPALIGTNMDATSQWIRSELETATREGRADQYVLAFDGPWGACQSVLTRDPASGTTVLKQWFNHKRPTPKP